MSHASANLRRDKEIDDADVIATRVYQPQGLPDPILIRIAKPSQRTEDGLYECRAEIRESGRIWVRPMVGVDALDSLQLALMLVGTDLAHLNDQLAGAISFSGAEGLGLPVPPDFKLDPIEEFPDEFPGQSPKC